jgi:anaerobic magnesium-protoporphyrin IX monomethyl ester cyclase
LPIGEATMPDWDYTAENRVLFGTTKYNTFFYRRVIRWFHSEWRDAHLGADGSAGMADRLRSKLGLWRDRLLVNLLARLPGLTVRENGGGVRD